jgi:hypothetical protein
MLSGYLGLYGGSLENSEPEVGRFFRQRLGAFCPKIGYGCARAVVNYAYSVDGRTYMGTNVKPFVILNTAEIYAAQFPKGKTVSLRIKPSNPDFSVLLDSENDVKRYIV